MEATKICIDCNEKKLISEFQFRNDTKKYRNQCRKCRSVKSKEKYSNNREKRLISQKKYNQRHKEEKREYDKIRYRKNMEEKKQYQKCYYKEHKIEIKEKKLVYQRNKRANDPIYGLRSRLSSKICRIINGKKSLPTLYLLGCSFNYFIQYIEQQFQPGMSWQNYGHKGWHIDHIIPCAWEGWNLTNIEHQKQCFYYKNLRPLWAYENWRKSNNIDEQIIEELLPILQERK